MEELNISTSAVVSHLLITCIPWPIGIVMRGGLGVLCELVVRVSSTRPALRRPWVLLPWRTFVMGLLMGVYSQVIVRLLGIGPIAAGVMVGGSAYLLVTAFTATTPLEDWHPSPLGSRLVSAARTLAVASGLIAAGVGLLRGGGLGHVIFDATRLMAYGLMWKGLLMMLTLAFAIHLTLGLLLMVVPAFWREWRI